MAQVRITINPLAHADPSPIEVRGRSFTKENSYETYWCDSIDEAIAVVRRDLEYWANNKFLIDFNDYPDRRSR
jgi:hypothetical protein